MSDDDKVLPFVRKEEPVTVVAEVGGLVDETKVTLALYGDDLDPVEVTALLGVEPTRARRRGDARPRGLPPWPNGAWFLGRDGKAPLGPEELLAALLECLPPSSSPVWTSLRERFDVQLRFGIFLEAWNRGFGVPAAQLEQLSAMVNRFEFDLYGADGDDE